MRTQDWWLRIASCAMLMAAASVCRAAETPMFTLRAGALGSDLSFDEGIHADNEWRSKLGFLVDGELRLSRTWGLDVAFGDLRMAVRSISIPEPPPVVIDESRGSVHIRPLLLGAVAHPLRNRGVDLWIGPVVGTTFISGDIGARRDTEAAFGGVVGIDVPLPRSAWAVSAAARFLHTRIPSVEEGNLVVNPVLVSAGVSYSW